MTIKPDIEPIFTIEPRPAASINRPKAAAAPEEAVEIDVEDIEPVLVGQVLCGRFGSRDAGVAYEDVDTALLLEDLRGGGVHGG